jgi:hydantoinase/carbamoylase family amidase
MVSSGVWAGEIPVTRAHELGEINGGPATMKSELARIGYLGTVPASHESTPMAAHFELHIEQGPILEAEKRKVGVVDGVQAYRWYTVDVHGREAHTGTTPFSARADALQTAARMLVAAHDLAVANNALLSTGVLTLEPGSVNTVPGHVQFRLDIRAASDGIVDKMEADIKTTFDALALNTETGGLPLTYSMVTDSVSPAINFHSDCIEAVRASAEDVLGTVDLMREMVSGAGHDSVYTSRCCPTSMVFVPCRNGVSHNPEEYTSPEDCAIGAQVLLQSVLLFDRQRV